MSSIKVGNACVRALLRRKRCVRRRLAKGVLFVAMRVCPRRVVSCPDPASQSPKGVWYLLTHSLVLTPFAISKSGSPIRSQNNQSTVHVTIRHVCHMYVTYTFNMEVALWRFAVPRFGACTRARDIDTAIASAFSVLGYDKPTRVQDSQGVA